MHFIYLDNIYYGTCRTYSISAIGTSFFLQLPRNQTIVVKEMSTFDGTYIFIAF